MYKVPSDTSLEYFAGRVLLQVCIGQNETILHFDDGLSIDIENAIAEYPYSGEWRRHDTAAGIGLVCTELLGESVKVANVVSETDIDMCFASKIIRLCGECDTAECYRIRHGSRVLIV